MLVYLSHDSSDALLTCQCGAHLSSADQILSKAFTGRLGRAMLVNTCVNVCITSKDERMLATGVHIVGDLTCIGCDALLGWRYLACP